MTAYYNEIDPYAADWLRNLIAAGHIAPGDVDTRSIADVCPDDLRGYTQCHFFAGIGVWSAALRGAGWPDDRPVWTGSCPCQPFSAAGRGDGFADERHLWPAWFHLISQRRPPVVFGEQVASKAVDPWIDLVQADMEAVGYAFGAVAFPAASVGAPHIRDRTYFVADTEDERHRRQSGRFSGSASPMQGALAGQGHGYAARPDSADGGLADTAGSRPQGSTGRGERPDAQLASAERAGSVGLLEDAASERLEGWDRSERNVYPGGGGLLSAGPSEGDDGSHRPGPTNGFWRDPDWLFCRDGRWRPVRSGSSPLAHGARSRVGRLRAYGNAINQKAAEEFILAYASDGVSLTLLSAFPDKLLQGAFR